MLAIVLKKTGRADQAFELQQLPGPEPSPHQVLIDVEASGINFADVLARRGLYQDAPALPFVPGYEVVGRIIETGNQVTDFQAGQRVLALTQFGGYANRAVANPGLVCVIPRDLDAVAATALGVQYTTAWLAACELTRLHRDDQVLVHSAAGGVGTALVQIAKHAGCTVFGTASGPKKIEHLKKLGVDHPIDSQSEDFVKRVRSVQRKNRFQSPGLDVIFDGVGGRTYRRGYQLLRGGGRLVGLGAASMLGRGSKVRALWAVLGFGIYHPVALMLRSHSLIGVYLLRLAQDRPELVSHALRQVVEKTSQTVLAPVIGGSYSAEQAGEAHTALESRQSLGKLAIQWR